MFAAALACMIALTSPVTVRTEPWHDLDVTQTRALIEAEPKGRDLKWLMFSRTVAGRPRTVVLLGESHLALPSDVAIAQKVIDQFQYFAVENGEPSDDPRWHYTVEPLAAAMLLPSYLFKNVLNGTTFDSPMDHAKTGAHSRAVHNVERFHVPDWTEEVGFLVMSSWEVLPFLLGGAYVVLGLVAWRRGQPKFIPAGYAAVVALSMTAVVAGVGFDVVMNDPLLSGRDPSMAEFIDYWAAHELSENGPLLVIVGSGHLRGLERYLILKYDFREQPINDILLLPGSIDTTVPHLK